MKELLMDFVLTSDSPEATRRLGACMAPLIEAGDTIVLTGDLGAGKTCFTQGLADGLGCPAQVTSPTFVIVHELKGRLCLYHLDLYRIATSREFVDLGLEETLFGDGVCVIEWGDRFMEELPPDRVTIDFHFEGDTARRIEVSACGERSARLASEWRRAC